MSDWFGLQVFYTCVLSRLRKISLSHLPTSHDFFPHVLRPSYLRYRFWHSRRFSLAHRHACLHIFIHMKYPYEHGYICRHRPSRKRENLIVFSESPNSLYNNHKTCQHKILHRFNMDSQRFKQAQFGHHVIIKLQIALTRYHKG
jgi:hypothetical protein